MQDQRSYPSYQQKIALHFSLLFLPIFKLMSSYSSCHSSTILHVIVICIHTSCYNREV